MGDPLVSALRKLAEADGLGVRGLARKIEMSPAMVCRALQGEPVGAKFIGRAIRAYPQLAPLAAESLRRLDDSVNEIERQAVAS